MRRVYLIDVLTCPRCKRTRRLLAFITDPDVVTRILRHLALPTEPPLVAPARPPPAAALPSFLQRAQQQPRDRRRATPAGAGAPHHSSCAHVTRVQCQAATAPLEHSAPAVHETTAGPPGGAFATPLYPLPPIVYLLVLVWMVGSAMRSEVGPPLLSIAAILAMWPIHFACECLRRR